jgi:broad specificity phosphatase PhoE
MNASSHREVWFVRHSESVANAGGRTREAPTYPLSELGFRQAEQLARDLHIEPELIIVSPYLRAQQTAGPAIRRFEKARVEQWEVHEVQYLDPAVCVDTTQDERRDLSRAYWERADPNHAAPGAESFAGFIARARGAMERLARRRERRTFVFSHGQFMSAVAWLTLTRPSAIDSEAMRRYHQFIHGTAVPNCAILPLFLHSDGSQSLGGLWVPEGVDLGGGRQPEAGFAGV